MTDPKSSPEPKKNVVVQMRVADGSLELMGAGTQSYLTTTTEEERKKAPALSWRTSMELELERGLGVHVRYTDKGNAYHYLVPMTHVRQLRLAVE